MNYEVERLLKIVSEYVVNTQDEKLEKTVR